MTFLRTSLCLIGFTVLLPRMTPAAEIAVFTRPIDGVYTGPWMVEVAVRGEADCRVFDEKGRLVAGPFAAKEFAVPDVRTWSAETPVCYRLRATIAGETRETVFAFAERVVKDGRLYVNGRPVRLKLAPKALNGNVVPATDCSREEALREGVYRLSRDQLDRLAVERPSAISGETRHRFQDWSVVPTNYFSRIVVTNRNAFRDASDVTLRWTVLRDGCAEKSGEIDLLKLKPGCSTSFDMPPEVVAARFGEGTVGVRFAFVRAGETIAEDQIDLVASRELKPFGMASEGWLDAILPACFADRVAYGELPRPDGSVQRRFTTDDAVFAYGTSGDGTVSYSKCGFFSDTELVRRVTPYREEPVAAAEDVVLDLPPSPVEEHGGALSFTDLDEVGPLRMAARWTVSPDGSVACQARLRAEGAAPHERLGVVLSLGSAVRRIEWFGRGPWSHGRTGTEGAFLGRWTTDPGEDFSAEETRGIRLGDLTVRTLGAPFAFRLQGGTRLLLAGDPGADGTVELAFTLSVGDRELTARTSSGEVSVPAFQTLDITSNGSESK